MDRVCPLWATTWSEFCLLLGLMTLWVSRDECQQGYCLHQPHMSGDEFLLHVHFCKWLEIPLGNDWRKHYHIVLGKTVHKNALTVFWQAVDKQSLFRGITEQKLATNSSRVLSSQRGWALVLSLPFCGYIKLRLSLPFFVSRQLSYLHHQMEQWIRMMIYNHHKGQWMTSTLQMEIYYFCLYSTSCQPDPLDEVNGSRGSGVEKNIWAKAQTSKTCFLVQILPHVSFTSPVLFVFHTVFF